MFVLATMMACHVGADGKATDTGSTIDTHADTVGECQEDTIVPFDECIGRLGAVVDARVVVTGGNDSGMLSVNSLTVLQSQDELTAFWAASGLEASGTVLPTVDFATEQVIAFARDTADCHGTSGVSALHVDADDSAALVAEIGVYDPCDQCDTGAVWMLDVWVARRSSLTSCQTGTRCGPCP